MCWHVLQTTDPTGVVKSEPTPLNSYHQPSPPTVTCSQPASKSNQLLLYTTRLIRKVRMAGPLTLDISEGLNSPYRNCVLRKRVVTLETLDHQVPPAAYPRLHSSICLCRALIGSHVPGLSPRQDVNFLGGGSRNHHPSLTFSLAPAKSRHTFSKHY